MATTMDLACEAAKEWRRLSDRGDVVQAGEVRRSIDELVGRWIDGAGGRRVWGWPASVVAIARGQAKTQGLVGYVPQAEVAS